MQIGPVNVAWTRPSKRVSDMLPSERVDTMRVVGRGIVNVIKDGDIDINDIKARLDYYTDLREHNADLASLREHPAWQGLRAELVARLQSFHDAVFERTLSEPKKAFVDAIEGLILGAFVDLIEDAAQQQFEETVNVRNALKHPERVTGEEAFNE